MQDHSFCVQNNGKPYYYVFIKDDAPASPKEAAFYRYDTVQEASALFNFIQTEHPDLNISLGIHKDFTRRADIIERTGGVTALSDQYQYTNPWKGDKSVGLAAKEASRRVGAAWRMDRELVGTPILIPNERSTGFLPEYFDGKSLCPEVLGQPQTSIQEAFVQGLGWMSLDGLKAVAKHRGYGNPEIPAVSHYLVAYRVDGNGSKGTVSISPAEYKTLEERYLAQLERRTPQKDGDIQADLDAIKQEAKARAQSQLRPTSPASRSYDHAL